MKQHLIVNLSILFGNPTGIATYAGQIIPYLKPLNPTLLTNQSYPNFNNHPIPGNLTPQQGRTGHLRRLLWTQFKIPQLYQQLKASLLFSPVPEAPLGGNCRSVVMVHDLIPLRFPKLTSPLYPYFRYYVPQVLQKALHIVCNSQATANDLIDFYGIKAQKITPCLLGYNPDNFKPQITPAESSYFLYVGRQDPYKNLPRLISAFAALPQRENYQLWLAGTLDQRYTPQLLQLADSLGIKHQVKFLGYISYAELPSLYNQALALIFPSLWEGFGIPVLEAMACGTPVITSNISSLPEVVGDAGLLIDPYNVSAITDALKTIAQDPQLRLKMRDLSLKRASQFSWQRTGELTKEILSRYL